MVSDKLMSYTILYQMLGNPNELLRTHSANLTKAIAPILCTVTDSLYAAGLIPLQTKENMLLQGVKTDTLKAMELLTVIQQQLKARSSKSNQYLVDICHVLIQQQHQTLNDIVTSMLQQLGQYIKLQPVLNHYIMLYFIILYFIL